MRVQPHFPSRPLTATVTSSSGAAFFACSAANSPAPPAPRIRMSGESWETAPLIGCAGRCSLPDPHGGQGCGAAVLRRFAHLVVEAAAVGIHGDENRPKALDGEAPEAFGVEVFEVHVLDRRDP